MATRSGRRFAAGSLTARAGVWDPVGGVGVASQQVTRPLVDTDAAPAEVARVIGRYVTIRRLGHGGAGVVYAAFDPHLDRKVALKLLHQSGAAGSALIREAKLLASLSHPNIVTVFDSGVHEDHAFLVMELVDGPHLGRFIADGPERSVADRIAVVISIARGLQAAHAAGVVHGDVKPSNVLVGKDGVARLGDFGIAQQVERRATQDDGSGAGTPAYMAPEQHAGRGATPRSDQYSLCVTAWEAIGGRYPFPDALTQGGRGGESSGTSEELRRSGTHEAEHRGRPVGEERIPRRIAAVLARGLDPDPDARWPSVAALCEALEAATRRRPTFAVLGGAAIVAAAAALGAGAMTGAEQCEGGAALVAEQWGEAQREQVTAAFEASPTPFAAATRERVVQRLDAYGDAWATEHRRACETTARGEQSATVLDLQMACLRRSKAQLRATVGVLGRARQETIERAILLVEGLPAPERCAEIDALDGTTAPPPEIAQEVVALEDAVAEASTHRLAGDYEASAARLDAAAIARATELGYLPLLAEVLLEAGHLQFEAGDYAGAEASSREALRVAMEAGRWSSAQHAVSALLRTVGVRDNRPAEALMLEPLGHALARRSGTPEGEAIFRTQLALVLEHTGREADAEAHLRGALDLLASEGDEGEAAFARLEAHSHLASLLTKLERFDEALAEQEVALAAYERVLGAAHPHTAMLRYGMGDALLSKGAYPEAAAAYDASLQVLRSTFGPRDGRVAAVLAALAQAHARLGETDRAVGELREAIDTFTAVAGEGDPSAGFTRLRLVDAYLRMKRYDEAESEARTAVGELHAALGEDHPSVLRSELLLPRVLREQGRFAEARLQLEALLPRQEKVLDPQDGHLSTTRALLGRVLLDLGDPAAAVVPLEAAWAVSQTKDYPSLQATIAFAYGRALVGVGRDEEGLELVARAREALSLATDDVSALEAEMDAWNAGGS